MAQDAIINRWDINGDVYDIQDAGRGRPLGVATLDENGRVPYTQLPESAIEFKGYWNANTNTPHLQDGTGTKGDLYYVDVAGTQDLGSGSQEFYVGDRVLYDGSVWKNISGDILEKAQQLFNIVHPIGEIYIQYPQQKDPETLYNSNGITSTWTLQTQYAGAFFRSSGGNASTFIDENDTLTKQGQTTAKNGLSVSNTLSVGSASSGGTANSTASGGVDHTHNMQHKHTRGTMEITAFVNNTGGTYGVFAFNGGGSSSVVGGAFSGSSASGKVYTGSGGGSAIKRLDFTASKTWEGVTSDSLTNTSTSASPTAKNNTGGASAYSHSHPVYLRGDVSLGNGDTETRPDNFTIQIWKRTA